MSGKITTYYYSYKGPLFLSLGMVGVTCVWGLYRYQLEPYMRRKRYRDAEEWADYVYQQEVEESRVKQ